ncbi:hypothetical protein FB567DRAFT_591509 [Paraphoma chrysanthemicola]|uniref:Uncharacterized protein n=1 Tax=Paraphoma chrysanthemicola TaxID=798071 RepID=A0A8K0VZ83_9PLEO|nr:hypothetical protein FB567DRAFT_591509 [Paraphoma chrysanthemicola]
MSQTAADIQDFTVDDNPNTLLWLDIYNEKAKKGNVGGPYTNDPQSRQKLAAKLSSIYSEHGLVLDNSIRQQLLHRFFLDEPKIHKIYRRDDRSLCVTIKGIVEGNNQKVADAVRSSGTNPVYLYTIRRPQLPNEPPMKITKRIKDNEFEFNLELFEAIKPFIVDGGADLDLGKVTQTFLQDDKQKALEQVETDIENVSTGTQSTEGSPAPEATGTTQNQDKSSHIIDYLLEHKPGEYPGTGGPYRRLVFPAVVANSNYSLKKLMTVTEVYVHGDEVRHPDVVVVKV